MMSPCRTANLYGIVEEIVRMSCMYSRAIDIVPDRGGAHVFLNIVQCVPTVSSTHRLSREQSQTAVIGED